MVLGAACVWCASGGGGGGLLAERGLEVGCMWHLRLENGWRV